MLLDNLRISRKLTLAFATVVLTMGAMGGWTFHALGALGQARAKAEEATQVLETLEQAKFYLARQENSYRGYLLSLDPYYLERVAKHRGAFQARLAALGGLVGGRADEAKVVTDVGAAAERWREQVVEAGRRLAVDPATHAQAVQMVGPKGIADALMGPAEDGIEQLSDAYSKRKAALLADQAKVTRTAYVTIAGCFVLALATAIGLGMLLTRAIARPVTALTEAMRQLAGGDFTADVPARGRADEVGLMAEAVSVFKDAGLEKLRLEGLTAEQRQAADAERARNEQAKAQAQAELAAVVGALGEGLERLSAGDLTHRIGAAFPAEYEKLKADFNGAIGQLEGAMSVVLGNVRAIRSGSSEMADAADHLSRRTEQQAANLEETAAALEEITVTMKKSASGATACAEVAEAARGDAQTSGSVVTQAVAAMSAIEASAREITNIIGVIDEIAFQTNLLALNAGVEAARAGDAGRGFAVVASEVRALAQRSANAAKEIKTLISTSSAQVGRGVELVDQTGVTLGRIVERVAQIDGLVSEIAAGAQEQSRGIVEVNTAVNQMDQLTQQNAAMVEESTAASHALSHEADTLDRLVSRFRVTEVAGGRTTAARPAAPPPRTVTALKTLGAGGAARKPSVQADSWEEF